MEYTITFNEDKLKNAIKEFGLLDHWQTGTNYVFLHIFFGKKKSEYNKKNSSDYRKSYETYFPLSYIDYFMKTGNIPTTRKAIEWDDENKPTKREYDYFVTRKIVASKEKFRKGKGAVQLGVGHLLAGSATLVASPFMLIKAGAEERRRWRALTREDKMILFI